jgi:hypothetical protein
MTARLVCCFVVMLGSVYVSAAGVITVMPDTHVAVKISLGLIQTIPTLSYVCPVYVESMGSGSRQAWSMAWRRTNLRRKERAKQRC